MFWDIFWRFFRVPVIDMWVFACYNQRRLGKTNLGNGRREPPFKDFFSPYCQRFKMEIAMRMLKKQKIVALMCVCVIGCAGCSWSADSTKTENTMQGTQTEESTSNQKTEASRDIFAMDTYMTVTAYGENAEEAVALAEEEIYRLEGLLSTGEADSEVGIINQNGSGVLSEDGAYLMERALELWQSTDGAFDVAIYPVMEAWGFTGDEFSVPSKEDLETLLPLTDADNIVYDAQSGAVSFSDNGMKIDFGGIAKGYTSARVTDIFRECGITSAMVNLGGNVQVLGTKTDGSKWRVAIQDPDAEAGYSYIGILEAEDCAVVTSGGYERYFEADGVTYHHIIDPETGYPANNGIVSATVVSTDGTLADGLSTSCYIMGVDKAVAYWQSHSDEFDMILMTDDDTLLVTEGIADRFTSEYDIELIEKEQTD